MSELHRVIAIDFDGTLCENRWPEIGAPIMEVIDAAKAEKACGSQLILLTMREGELLEKALKFCESFGLTFDAVNDNTAEWKVAYGNNPRKIGATEYWDDRAFNPVKEFKDSSVNSKTISNEDKIVNSVVTKFIEKNPRFKVLAFTYTSGSHFVRIKVRDITINDTFWCGEQY